MKNSLNLNKSASFVMKTKAASWRKKSRKGSLGIDLKKLNQYLYKLDGQDLSKMLLWSIEEDGNEDDLSKLLRWCMEPQKCPSVNQYALHNLYDKDGEQQGSSDLNSVPDSLLHNSKHLDLKTQNQKQQGFLPSLQEKFYEHILAYEDDDDIEDVSKVLPLLCTDDEDLSKLFSWCMEPPPDEAMTTIMDDKIFKADAICGSYVCECAWVKKGDKSGQLFCLEMDKKYVELRPAEAITKLFKI